MTPKPEIAILGAPYEQPRFDSGSLVIAIREALRVSNADALNETTATFQRRGIYHVARQLAQGLATADPDHFHPSAFMQECGFGI